MKHRILCPLCEATCGLEVTVQEGQVQGIRGDTQDPFSAGYLCPKGYSLKALEEDPDRLRSPQLRDGTTISWEEAFERIEAGLGPHLARDRNSIGVYLGNPNVHNLAGQLYVPAFLKMLGSRSIFSASSLDQQPKHLACGLMFGDPMSIPIPDLERTNFLLILGANPLESNGSLLTAPNMLGRFKAIKARGGQIVVFDPRRTRTAQEATRHHFLQPGTDALLLMALIQELFRQGLVRPGPQVEGVEAMHEACQPFTAATVAPICRVSAETISELARQLAEAPGAAVYGRLGTCTQSFGTLTSWLVEVVNVLTGNLDRPGGALFPKAAAGARNTVPGKGRNYTPGAVRTRVRGLPQINGEFPSAALAEEILTPGEGQIRALITIAGNPAVSAPNSSKVRQALQSLDFFVAVDCYRNETTGLADLILPVPSHLQRSHYDLVFSQLACHNYARYSAPVFPSEQPQEWEILVQLGAIVAGLGRQIPSQKLNQQILQTLMQRQGTCAVGDHEGPELLLDYLLRQGPYALTLDQLRQGPVDLGPLQPRIPEVLRTASGKVELAPALLLEDLPRLQERLQQANPEMCLIGRRQLRSNNSWMHNLPVLVKGPPACTLLIHPQDADRLGLNSGDKAGLRSSCGQLEVSVEVTPEVMPGVVSLPHGWGHHQPHAQMAVARQHCGVNANEIVPDETVEPLTGNAIQNGIPVEIERL